jgi:hypothetical protein
MTASAYLARRNQYSYPAVGLGGSIARSVQRKFASLTAMENHHRTLLRSEDDARAVLGYLSVLYWGHYSGQRQRSLGPRALSRVRLAKEGADRRRNGHVERIRGVADLGVPVVAAKIRRAVGLVDTGQYGEALKALSYLPQLNFAFASKVCAFILPERCGVIDSVIAAAYPHLGFERDPGGYVRNNKTNADRYTKYCEFLAAEASKLNAKGHDFRWRDLDGAMRLWRAVDVERAMYEA